MSTTEIIDSDYEWDLTKFCKNDEVWFNEIKKLKPFASQFGALVGQLHIKEKLKEYYKLSDEFADIYNPLHMYIANKHNRDLENPKFIEMSGVLDALSTQVDVATSFYSPEMLLSKECGEKYLEELIADKNFENQIANHEDLLDELPHTLSHNEEKIVSRLGGVIEEFSNIFEAISGVDEKFEPVVDSNGKLYDVNSTSIITLLESFDRTLRKNAAESWYNGLQKHENALATNYIASVKTNWAIAEIYKHKSVLDEALYEKNVSKNTYEKLIENVENNIDLNKSYFTLRKKILGLDEMKGYDCSVPLAKVENTEIDFDSAYKIVCTALSSLGKDYTDILERARREKWIDVFPAENKTSGAYQWGCYGYSPVILLNYGNSIGETLAIAHELGHAINTVLTEKKQPKQYGAVQEFLDEVASTTNEVLMMKYLIKNAKTSSEKIYYLDQYCKLFTGTLFYQTLLSEFEQFAHGRVEKDEPISKEILSCEYKKLELKFDGDAFSVSNKSNIYWTDISHFYDPFYCFQYATGLTAAVCLASKITNHKSNAVENLITFLSSGCSDQPNEILKDAGVDLESNEPYNYAFAEFKWAISELEKTFEKTKEKYSTQKQLTAEKALEIAPITSVPVPVKKEMLIKNNNNGKNQ